MKDAVPSGRDRREQGWRPLRKPGPLSSPEGALVFSLAGPLPLSLKSTFCFEAVKGQLSSWTDHCVRNPRETKETAAPTRLPECLPVITGLAGPSPSLHSETCPCVGSAPCPPPVLTTLTPPGFSSSISGLKPGTAGRTTGQQCLQLPAGPLPPPSALLSRPLILSGSEA